VLAFLRYAAVKERHPPRNKKPLAFPLPLQSTRLLKIVPILSCLSPELPPVWLFHSFHPLCRDSFYCGRE